ncbi:MAG: hypothetical protein HY830_01615 [Actinobacteria bacterium]|nr:hypothetical protein [Actinomycetota bacterium]
MRLPGFVGGRPTGRALAAVQFVISASALLLVITTAGLFVLQRVARDEALRDATELTRVVTDVAIRPHVSRALLDGDPAELAALEAAEGAVLGDVIVRVKLWAPDGRIVWSDENRLIGTAPGASSDIVEVARTGVADAEFADPTADEHTFEQGQGELLEVYVPVVAADGTRLVAETYQTSGRVAAATHAIWWSYLPVMLIALVALALAQMPLALWWGRRSRAEAEERVELLARAELARQDERSRIASDLHDTVVQDLAGMAFDLAATASSVHRRSTEELATTLREGAETSRSSIAQLRAMLIKLHPGDAPPIDLARELPELAADLKGRGVRVDVDIDPVSLDHELRALLFRAAQEGVRNVARHAAATRATISLTARDGVATLLIEDDGQGMSSRDLVKQRAAGHVGLTLLADRVRAQQGELTISSEPGRGTRLVVWLPLEARKAG